MNSVWLFFGGVNGSQGIFVGNNYFKYLGLTELESCYNTEYY